MITQLKLPVNQHDDVLAWFPDKLGMFTVKSTYRLALDLSMGEGNGSSSSSPDGNRKIWDVIWRCNLATNSLAVQANRCKRIKNTKPTCEICGMSNETGYHAMMACPKARDLRQHMRQDWKIPPENLLKQNGEDWVLVLLDSVSPSTRQHLLFLWWRAWHHRNDVLFNKGSASIEESARLICGYARAHENLRGDDAAIYNSLNLCNSSTVAQSVADLDLLTQSVCSPAVQSAVWGIWRPPAPNWQKLNVDASFSEHSKEAWWSGVLRTCNGEIVVSAWGQIVNCSSPNEAETAAWLLGIETLCMQPGVNLHLESDCQQLVNNLNSNSVDRSSSCFLLQEIRRALVSCNDFLISWVCREGNSLGHVIAQYARLSKMTDLP
ncbi:hypothetical protein BRADI_4g13881v3 [Brachypodium distachyon]|uniref:RNase H type-1 domain-containing protein n=1 Tax=Brachypodium distachyon TaxID=15368 RepID=A0A2K2CMN2_BRADI|nr:hypothetical protein BRADI_4g13881v3 [Brachypodium distachyon]